MAPAGLWPRSPTAAAAFVCQEEVDLSGDAYPELRRQFLPQATSMMGEAMGLDSLFKEELECAVFSPVARLRMPS